MWETVAVALVSIASGRPWWMCRCAVAAGRLRGGEAGRGSVGGFLGGAKVIGYNACARRMCYMLYGLWMLYI